MNNKGILIVLSGFSGAGKGTIMKQVMASFDDRYALSISATTRGPRVGEEHGREYFFITVDEFEQMIADNNLIEYAKYVENYYGTPRKFVEDQLSAGKSVILEIEIQGALKIKEKFPDTRLLFVSAPSAKEQYERLAGRGTETEEVIKSRLRRAADEAIEAKAYDYLIINDTVDNAVSLFDNIVQAEINSDTSDYKKYLVSENIEFLDNMREELLNFLKGE